MAKIIGSPSRYVQGAGELSHLREHVSLLGKNLFILTSPSGRGRVEGKIAKSLEGSDAKAVYEAFNGECCMTEINRIKAAFDASGCDLIVGIGGGKIHDTAKAAAYYAKVPVVIVPTIASTDAPCSALSVIYTDDGVFEKYLFLPANPNMVLVDTEIVAAAPARLLVSGMGDALATYFEARACRDSNAGNCVGGTITLAAMQLARLCYETLLSDGLKAKLAVERKACTKAVENIIEANTYLSGVGFESGGLAGAHAIHNGLTALPATHAFYHGEKVAFGTLVQLVLENAPMEELAEVLDFCAVVGLPTTLAELNIADATDEQLMEVAKLACADGDTLHNMPFPVTPESVYAAILAADQLGKQYKA
ncbi:MAG TPA: glycerol dehydrogenase [Candidatus Flavonifractor merdipullorum]|uniref:Glycerol dehydrogenase n=1 Tax=Candidatus Flavonifractor merdipullorum TaxID=2838590 RepID=A0A9D1RXM9_9FIRM|nr:glycerol dehydrogenase [Candidatus Flavonifractor merdipullorum]